MSRKWIGWISALALLAVGCKSHQLQDTQTSGHIRISVDETYQPLIDTELKVFHDLHDAAHITPAYKPEGACIEDLLNDSVRLVIVTRDLNERERKYFKDIQIPVTSKAVARDAVALVVNPANDDTTMTMDEVRAIMAGKDSGKYELVFDNQNSSLVRYVIDSINGGRPLPPGTKAADSCAGVVNYVAANRNALGVIGVSWVSNPYDSTGLSFLSKVRVVGIMGDSTYHTLRNNPGFDPSAPEYRRYYFKPYQAYIALRSYPLTRSFFFILREPYFGLGTGFANFLGGNQGQLIIGQFGLFPLNMNIQFREATIH